MSGTKDDEEDVVSREGPHASSAHTTIPLADVGSAVRWLRERADVPIGRIARAFGMTAGHARQLLFRERHKTIEPDVGSPFALGIRRDDACSLPPDSIRRDECIDALREQVRKIHEHHVATGDYLGAARQLKRLHMFPGYPSSHGWLQLLSQLHREQAWFLGHAGHERSAVLQAQLAIETGRRAYRQAVKSRDARADLREMMEAALVASHSNLLRQTPSAALKWLEIAEDAAEAARLPLGSDYYRQRGMFLFQMGADAPAQRYFDKSARRMEELGKATRLTDLRHTGPRYIYFMSGDWESAAQLVADTAVTSGGSSLFTVVATTMAVATGLSVDSPEIATEALNLLTGSPSPAESFGHQRTGRFLLSRTPELGLRADQRRAWLRHALYVNAYRNR